MFCMMKATSRNPQHALKGHIALNGPLNSILSVRTFQFSSKTKKKNVLLLGESCNTPRLDSHMNKIKCAQKHDVRFSRLFTCVQDDSVPACLKRTVRARHRTVLQLLTVLMFNL